MKRVRIAVQVIMLILVIQVITQVKTAGQNATSEAHVEFKAGTGPTKPVDPEDPESETGGETVEGSLAIVKVSQFDFGEIAVTSGKGNYSVKTEQPNIQVVDLRGTGTGWKVLANVTRFTSGGEETLPGATIHVEWGRANSISTSDEPEQEPGLKLTTDGSTELVMRAKSGAGMGLWIMRWYPASVEDERYIKLEIPAGSASVGNHSATINWILEDAP